MAEHTDIERLDWVLLREPEFGEGYLRIWMGPMAAEAAGFSAVGGYYIAEGDTKRECIDNAMSGRLELVE
ncbi:TPA: hypothetical protein L4559_003508 [Pseudomonas aeruginosa]|nr:hypothetical protein [Pseudomonas aeruginosa]